ncbi:ABC transporter substrate-binding protein [Corticibacter populi]|uniref:ABC transporter substrate-binding protein n=1 Tax=Corticibacter populi TaxID=1550736 RepID=A0A3M6QTQ2_9BURK|nr:ABC transporter substrate-binding protein [Corticibacter populi]RMX05852.1 ABC transporter substrate-binding protein [Corticibacter populi]RZS30830.1 ABC-type nitrate/sulfonate/bicarbonate transport system substrate-binding protein [Corticibacter populi]
MTNPLQALWYTRCGVPTGFGLAKQAGFIDEAFARQGTRLQSIKESDDPRVRESHFDHSLQNSVRYGGNGPAVWARASGSPTRLIGVSTNGDHPLLLASEESGIKSIRDLKGRRFGLPRWFNQSIDFAGASALRTLESALRLEGLEVGDVEIVDYPVASNITSYAVSRIEGTETFKPRELPDRPKLVPDLLRGKIDAMASLGRSGLNLVREFSLTQVFDLADHPDPLARANNNSPLTLAVDQHLLDRHYDSVVTLVQQILKAERWAREHRQEARTLIAREVHASEYWIWNHYETAQGGLGIDTHLEPLALAALQDYADFLLRWKFVPARVDVNEWLDPRPLADARQALAATAS